MTLQKNHLVGFRVRLFDKLILTTLLLGLLEQGWLVGKI